MSHSHPERRHTLADDYALLDERELYGILEVRQQLPADPPTEHRALILACVLTHAVMKNQAREQARAARQRHRPTVTYSFAHTPSQNGHKKQKHKANGHQNGHASRSMDDKKRFPIQALSSFAENELTELSIYLCLEALLLPEYQLLSDSHLCTRLRARGVPPDCLDALSDDNVIALGVSTHLLVGNPDAVYRQSRSAVYGQECQARNAQLMQALLADWI